MGPHLARRERAPQRQPHSTRGPGGRLHLTFMLRPRRSTKLHALKAVVIATARTTYVGLNKAERDHYVGMQVAQRKASST